MKRTISMIALSLVFAASCASTSMAQGRQGGARTQAGQQAGPARTTPSTQTKQAAGQPQPAAREPMPVAELMRSTAEDRRSVEVTVYNNDLGLVKEVRDVRVGAGLGELHFIDVPSKINPVTVHINPLSGAGEFAVLEQNYEYDLISHERLMDKYVGQTIKIMQWNQYQDRHVVVDAELLSMANGEVYKIDNEIYLGHPGIKILPELPENLISRPTLSWVYRSSVAREQKLEVSYLTSGMNWSADYIISIVDGGTITGGLSGWVTINNRSGAAFENARLKLVAGEVNRVREGRGGRGGANIRYGAAMADMVAESAPAFAQSEVFEYHMYDLQRPTTLRDNQTKQISLMEAQGVTIIKEYVTSSSFMGIHRQGSTPNAVVQPVVAFLKFKNSRDNSLGDPLPAGTVRIYTADDLGRQQFIGEDRISHTPRDEEVRLRAGEVFDIVAERTQVSFRQISTRMHESEWAISVRNRKNEDVTVFVQETAHGDWTVTESSHRHTRPDANTIRFEVPVGRGQEVAVKYKLRTGI